MAELRKRTDQLPDDYWVVLVGDMITEEALPTYMAMRITLEGVRDETGAANTPWGRSALALSGVGPFHMFCTRQELAAKQLNEYNGSGSVIAAYFAEVLPKSSP